METKEKKQKSVDIERTLALCGPGNKLLAKYYSAKNEAAAFLELRNVGFWVFGQFYDPRGVRGPEVKIDLSDIEERLLEKLKKRASWAEPIFQELEDVINTAWERAAAACPWFSFLKK